MLTVKFERGHVTKIVEADSVDIFPCGPGEHCAPDPKDRTNDVREVSVNRGDKNEVFHVGNDNEDWWSRAYVENQNGKTVEIIRPY